MLRARLAAFPIAASSALFALAALALSRTAEPPSRLRDLGEHEEARSKRVQAAVQAIARGGTPSAGLPPSVEGRDRGWSVTSYDLSFRIDPRETFLAGRAVVRVLGSAPSTSAIDLDLDRAYALSETAADGRGVTVSRTGDRLTLLLDPPLRSEERATISLGWNGAPPSYSALQYFDTSRGRGAGTVAEPFGAPTFWPCHDDPLDRANVTVRLDVPEGYTGASSGDLVETTAAGGRATFTWRLREPIPTYLVSIAVAPYVRIDATYRRLDGTDMPVVGYVLPEHEAIDRPRIAAIPGHIATLASLFGEYPFASSKYGVVANWFRGGMEHPTLTSIGANILGDAARDVTILFVHELGHQWWGDEVTLRTWDDIFLNEGFATYSEVLYRETALGQAPGGVLALRYDDGLYSGALAGTVVADAADPFADTNAVYAKGGWFLHMLRRRVGDAAFFAGLRAYRARHGLATATRGELRALFEERTGRDLKGFFDQWLETPYRPILRGAWRPAADASSVDVTVSQAQTHSVRHPSAAAGDVTWYRFPLRIRVAFTDGTTRDADVEVGSREETFRVETPERKPVASLAFDPASDLLKVVQSVGRI